VNQRFNSCHFSGHWEYSEVIVSHWQVESLNCTITKRSRIFKQSFIPTHHQAARNFNTYKSSPAKKAGKEKRHAVLRFYRLS